ncbi:hypothetical protein [Williamsia sp. DF01-3]|uniref:hypothetical protein n=1 Tax=Williamsia sp. DF01-3 TaxID=2934157 RepID=UPI001FF5AB70|nr:hypothetical protein [Williamsia sp. DF01-3]MCK0519772.1 hypothetical protein [Williamsia sp. DF01-3]
MNQEYYMSNRRRRLFIRECKQKAKREIDRDAHLFRSSRISAATLSPAVINVINRQGARAINGPSDISVRMAPLIHLATGERRAKAEILVSDTISASERPAEAGVRALSVITKTAASVPDRVAAQYGGSRVTYGRLQMIIDEYRILTAELGLDDNAAVYAAVMHTLPDLGVIDDPYEMAGVVTALLSRIVDTDLTPSVS